MLLRVVFVLSCCNLSLRISILKIFIEKLIFIKRAYNMINHRMHFDDTIAILVQSNISVVGSNFIQNSFLIDFNSGAF